MLLLEPPASGEAMEQLLGRLHRPGQYADEVVVYTYEHCSPYENASSTARGQAQYIEDSTGNTQKLNFARYV